MKVPIYIPIILIVVFAITFAITLLFIRPNQSEMEVMSERIATLNADNDLLYEDIKKRDRLIVIKDIWIIKLEDSLEASIMRVGNLEYNYSALESDFKNLSDSLQAIPVDTSYRFLVDEAYPYPGHLKYPFNELQVKEIHKSFLENIKFDEMNLNLLSQISEKDYQLEVKDTIVHEQAEEMILMDESRMDLDSIILNKDQIIEVQGEQIHKVKRGKTFWQITTGVIVGLLAAVAVGGG